MRLIQLLVLSLATAGATAAHAAGEPSGEEAAGVGVGAVVGALAGGPAGAIVGAAIGAKIGDSAHQRKEEAGALKTRLEASRGSVRELEQTVAVLEADSAALRAEVAELSASELEALLEAGIEMDLLFRTDEHVLNDVTSERLAALAATLKTLPEIRVRLDGFADERGDADYNQALSERRAESVRASLIAAGVPSERIDVDAHGESDAADDTVDSYALERKVRLTLFVGDPSAFAAAAQSR